MLETGVYRLTLVTGVGSCWVSCSMCVGPGTGFFLGFPPFG